MSLLYRIICDGYILLDQTRYGGDYDMTEAVLDLEINDGMFDGRLEFTIPMYHPNADKIRPMASTIVVTEIRDGTERIRFRGRPVSVRPDFGYLEKVTCESDIRFLEDVPDIFSKMMGKTTIYKIGSEKQLQAEAMTRVPTGDLKPRPVTRGMNFNTGESVEGYEDCQLSRFSEKTTYGNGSDFVYRSEVRSIGETDIGTRVGLSIYNNGNTRYSNYIFQAKEIGKKFTVEWHGHDGSSATYEIPLKACSYETTLYEGTGIYDNYTKNPRRVRGIARYLGNIEIIANDNFDIAGFNPAEEIPVVGENRNTNIGALPFCIVHYSTAPHWTISKHQNLIFWFNASETIVYTHALSTDKVESVSLRVFRNGGTNVRAMATAIFGGTGDVQVAKTAQAMIDQSKRYLYEGVRQKYRTDDRFVWDGVSWVLDSQGDPEKEWTEVTTPQAMTDVSLQYKYVGEGEEYLNGDVYIFNGSSWVTESLNYNNYVSAGKMIFLGDIAIDADVEYTSVASCYSNLQKWLSETGGYAKIRAEDDGLYYLDLLADSGVQSDDFYVTYGKNVLDASEDISCSGMVTGIYVKGVWNGQDQEESDDSGDEGEESVPENPTKPSQADPDYELLFKRLDSLEAPLPKDMTDSTKVYQYTGPGTTFYPEGSYTGNVRHPGYYQYDENKKRWVEYIPAPGQFVYFTAESPQAMNYTDYIYKYTGPITTIKRKHLYRYDGTSTPPWKEDLECVVPILPAGFELDVTRGVIWNTEARKIYGEIVSYLEVDVANVVEEGQRMQHMADEGIKELKKKLLAIISFDISAADPMVVGLDGDAPELGNYYPIDIPWLGLEHEYQRLTKLSINMLDQKNIKMTLGNKAPLLSDYAAEKGERL